MAEEAAAPAAPEPQATIAASSPEAATTDVLSSDSIAAEAGEATAEGEAKPDGDKPEGDKPAEDTPIEYEIKLPEGIQADDQVMGQFKDILGEAKVPQETAQKLVDLHSSTLQKVANAPYDTWRNVQQEWQNEIKSDPEIGGKNLAQSQATIAKLVDSLGSEQAKAFRQALNFTGAGNNPAIVRALVQIGKMNTEGNVVPGNNPAPQPKSAASKIYPSLSS